MEPIIEFTHSVLNLEPLGDGEVHLVMDVVKKKIDEMIDNPSARHADWSESAATVIAHGIIHASGGVKKLMYKAAEEVTQVIDEMDAAEAVTQSQATSVADTDDDTSDDEEEEEGDDADEEEQVDEEEPKKSKKRVA